MDYVKPEDTELGDILLVPIHGEFMNREQICQKYKVVKALECLTPAKEQIVVNGEEPMPQLMPLIEGIAIKA